MGNTKVFFPNVFFGAENMSSTTEAVEYHQPSQNTGTKQYAKRKEQQPPPPGYHQVSKEPLEIIITFGHCPFFGRKKVKIFFVGNCSKNSLSLNPVTLRPIALWVYHYILNIARGTTDPGY